MTPERLAAMEVAASEEAGGGDEVLQAAGVVAKKIDEEASPVAGRRFTRS